MNKIYPLMQREWLQHRFSWALTAGIPLVLAALLLVFGQVQIDDEEVSAMGSAMPAVLAMASIAGTMAVIFGIAAFSSLVTVSALARRDHADRSIEFWLSLPVSHSASLGAPLLVHLLLVPAVAVLVGLAGGYAMSAILVTRVVGPEAWLSLPWSAIVPATFSLAARLLAGLPLALLWLSPLILLVMLLTALFRRWGWVILTVGLGLGGLLMKQLFGQPWINEVTVQLLKLAGHALINGGANQPGEFSNGGQMLGALNMLPSWALADFGGALGDLATPLLPGALLFAAACFVALLKWRERGASASA